MCPDVFRTLAVECLQLAQKTDNPERRSLLIDMAYSWTDLANSAERFERLVETAASVNRSPERSAVSPIKAAGWRLPHHATARRFRGFSRSKGSPGAWGVLRDAGASRQPTDRRMPLFAV